MKATLTDINKTLSAKPEPIKDVHTEHCCILHGCKYGKDDVCTVVQKIAPQSYVCESCDVFCGIHDLATLNAVKDKKQPTCPHCGHVL